MDPLLLIPALASFFIVLFAVPIWIKRARRVGLIGKDIHKIDKKEVAEGGGIAVLFGFILGVLIYIELKTFWFGDSGNLIEIFAILTSILIAGGVGFLDDIFGWKIGLNKKTRIIFMIFAAIPLVVINAGESVMAGIEFGGFYPLLLIPLGIVGASTTFNFLAGYNGLESSQGILILSGLGLVTWMTGNSWLSVICLIMVACLLTFYFYNKTPAKVFPGDSLTYSVGALIAIVAILGNIEKIAIFFFIPYIIETGLKVRGGLKKESFARVNDDGSLENRHSKFYGLEHIAVSMIGKLKKSGKVYEKEVVWLINGFQLLIILLGFLIFRGAF